MVVIFGRNELTAKQRERIVRLVREGRSFRAVERLTGHRRETISRYVRRDDTASLAQRCAATGRR